MTRGSVISLKSLSAQLNGSAVSGAMAFAGGWQRVELEGEICRGTYTNMTQFVDWVRTFSVEFLYIFN